MADEIERVPPKEKRCALSACPLAGKGDPKCEQCRGPVCWRGRDGKLHGIGGAIHRSCTSCPMNGLGLPVCWAGCKGPNPEFQTDGQSMVTLGGMPDSAAYLGRYMSPRSHGSGEKMFSAMEMALASAILRMDADCWRKFSAACDRSDARGAAKAAGVPLAAFRGPRGKWAGSPAERMMAAMGGLSQEQLEIVRGLAHGLTQKRIADLSSGVSKQAVHTRLGRLKRDRPWVFGINQGDDKK